MSEMVERVATIINRAGHCDWRLEACRAGSCQCKTLAHSIIEAMREPTEAMMKAAATIGHDACPGTEWEPMIDAALTEPKPAATRLRL